VPEVRIDVPVDDVAAIIEYEYREIVTAAEVEHQYPSTVRTPPSFPKLNWDCPETSGNRRSAKDSLCTPYQGSYLLRWDSRMARRVELFITPRASK
jgi:hypothetical protein